MGIVYTEKQQQVIDTHGRNVLVSAAAGSGKTAVLTERIVKMISNENKPVDIDRLLVVTFTNAAAAEMRERISKAIAARLEKEPDNEHLQKQATLIHNAQITTIDSFCMFIIRNNFNDIGLDPGFRVADEGELKLLRQDVMKALLEEKYGEKDKAFLDCVEYFSTGNHDRAVEDHILKLYQFAESNPWPEEWLMERKADYAVESVEELDQAPFMQTGMKQIRNMTKDCLYRIKECIAVCEQPDGPYMYGEALEREAERLKKLTDFEYYHEGYELFQSMVFDRLPSKKDDSVSPEKRERIQEIRKGIKDTLKGICGRFFPAPPERVAEYMKGSREAVIQLVDLTLAFRQALERKKREENIIDFGDMEHLALSILVRKTADGGYEPTRTALDYRDYFEEILIDEYQDSNLVQELLLKSVSGEEEGCFNRFMVGDVKQSIYKFRLARPEIFMNKYDTYTAESEREQRIDLHKNFRSRTEVLNSVNDIFMQIMGRELGGIEYDEEAALYPGADYPEPEEDAEPRLRYGDYEKASPYLTELLLVRKEQNTEEKAGEKTKEKTKENRKGNIQEDIEDGERKKLTDRQREALAVAGRIKELVGHFKVTDKESGGLRLAEYRDIVILLRTNAGWDEDFKSIFKEEGIPSHVASKTGYFAAKEVQVLLQLLRILDNPRQDIPLFGVMKSYFGGFSDEEIARIRTLSAERGKNLYFRLQEIAMQEENQSDVLQQENQSDTMQEEEIRKRETLSDEIRQKVIAFLAFVNAYRDKTVYMPIHELVQEIILETGYLHYIAAMPGGEQRKANVQILLEKAVSFEQTSYYGLFHFIRYIEQLEKYDVDYGEANILDENADVVRIMSIHKSKGLEFPICFVCGLAKRFNMQDVSGRMIADVDMGIGVDYVDIKQRLQSKTVRKNIIAEKMRLDNLGEELRILYVALTRAKEKLIMSGTIEEPEKRLEEVLPNVVRNCGKVSYGELAGAGCYLDFILPALYGQNSIKVGIIGEEDMTAAKIKEQIGAEGRRKALEHSHPVTDTDKELMTYMSDIFSYQYEHSNLADLYTKTTVSELKKAGQEEEKEFSFKMFEEETVVPYIPKFMMAKESLGGAGRGSAFHKVMELLCFEETAGSVEEQMQEMVRDKMLSEEYAGAVSIPLIEKFLSTRLAKRMAKADRKGLLYREQPFVLGLSAKELNAKFPEGELVLIQGIIDVYFEEEGELVVADYKTDKVSAGSELIAKYQKQLEYYERALQELTGKRVKEKVLYSFGLNEEIVI